MSKPPWTTDSSGKETVWARRRTKQCSKAHLTHPSDFNRGARPHHQPLPALMLSWHGKPFKGVPVQVLPVPQPTVHRFGVLRSGHFGRTNFDLPKVSDTTMSTSLEEPSLSLSFCRAISLFFGCVALVRPASSSKKTFSGRPLSATTRHCNSCGRSPGIPMPRGRECSESWVLTQDQLRQPISEPRERKRGGWGRVARPLRQPAEQAAA